MARVTAPVPARTSATPTAAMRGHRRELAPLPAPVPLHGPAEGPSSVSAVASRGAVALAGRGASGSAIVCGASSVNPPTAGIPSGGSGVDTMARGAGASRLTPSTRQMRATLSVRAPANGSRAIASSAAFA